MKGQPVTAGRNMAQSAGVSLVVGHKADTLEQLARLLTGAVIDPHLCVGFADWSADPGACMARAAAALPSGPVIVRSCFSQEDGWTGSRAGVYLSRGDFDVSDRAALADAITAVFASYPETKNERVLVQHQVTAVRAAGVAMMRGMVRDASYYILEYDDVSGRTDTVTGGRAGTSRTLVILRGRADDCGDPVFQSLLPVLREIEDLAGHDRLEVEFAIDGAGQVHVFQVRPMPPAERVVEDERLLAALNEASAQYDRLSEPQPHLLGARALFGIMPDWNPAEIIGTAPRRLAFDLYRDLITDRIWARQRAEFGYCDLGDCPLLADFAGHPYVDVRASFNSFIPAGLPLRLAQKLADHYLDRLAAHPALHDKVEFEVAVTCLSPDFPRHGERLAEAGFRADEIEALRAALLPVTRHAWERVRLAEQALEKLGSRPAKEKSVRAILEICRDCGTLPFAHLARCGFIATIILRGLVNQGVITASLADAFLASLNTVAGNLVTDAEAVAAGSMSWNGFVAAYGHLRPDTYEITAPRYDQNTEKFLRPLAKLPAGGQTKAPAPFHWPLDAAQAIEQSLRAMGLPDSMAAFDTFARRAIEGREKGKFLFSRLLSDALEAIAMWGESAGVGRECLSHSRLEDVLAAMAGMLSADALRARSEGGAQEHAVALALELPPLIAAAGDFFAFEEPPSQPSFVGREECVADCILVSGEKPPPREAISGRIVLVERADPGWDWLFGCGIAGLVTAFGGANSHIVVRAAELSLPSAIGVGEHRFRELALARRLRIAPDARMLEIVT